MELQGSLPCSELASCSSPEPYKSFHIATHLFPPPLKVHFYFMVVIACSLDNQFITSNQQNAQYSELNIYIIL